MHGIETQAAIEKRSWLSSASLFLFAAMLFAGGAVWDGIGRRRPGAPSHTRHGGKETDDLAPTEHDSLYTPMIYTPMAYTPMAKGFLSLAVIMDWVSRAVLAWRLSNTLSAELCVAVPPYPPR
jgi:hypothetical protein